MARKIVGTLLIALLVQGGGLLFGMEQKLPFIADLSIGTRTGANTHYSLAASSSEQDIKQGIAEEAARDLCRQKYRTGQELSDLMLENANEFNLPIVMVFVEHGADLEYALNRILQKSDISPETLRIWVLFCLTHGARIPQTLEEVVKNIIGERINGLIEQVASQSLNLDTLQEGELNELFFLAIGQGQHSLLESILANYAKLISPEIMREGFLNAAYAGQEGILRVLYQHNKKEIREKGAWRKTLEYALFHAALRQQENIFNLILGRRQLLMQGFDLNRLMERILILQSLEELPSQLYDNYRVMLDELIKASRDNTIECITLRSSQEGPAGREITQIRVCPSPRTPESSTPPNTAPVRRRAQTELQQPHKPRRRGKSLFHRMLNRRDKPGKREGKK